GRKGAAHFQPVLRPGPERCRRHSRITSPRKAGRCSPAGRSRASWRWPGRPGTSSLVRASGRPGRSAAPRRRGFLRQRWASAPPVYSRLACQRGHFTRRADQGVKWQDGGQMAMTRADKVLVVLLRCLGVGSLFALVAVVMPFSWMVATHRWLGLGGVPDGPVVEDLARSLSAFYALFGALFLLVAADLERYRPLVPVVA